MSITAQLIFWQWAAGILGFALLVWMVVVGVVIWHAERAPAPRYRRGGAL